MKGIIQRIVTAIALVSILTAFNCRDYHYYRDMADSPSVDAQQYDEIGKRVGNLIPPKKSIPYKSKYYALKNTLADHESAGKLLDNPYSKKSQMVAVRGSDRYRVFCSPCHGLTGHGDGTIKAKLPTIKAIAGLNRNSTSVGSVNWPVQRIYHSIRVGVNSMPAYGSQIPEKDMWLIANYVKLLQKREKNNKPAKAAR